LQINKNLLGPAAGLIGFGESNALANETRAAIEKFSGLSDRQEVLVLLHDAIKKELREKL
jgi:hypothetical protein